MVFGTSRLTYRPTTNHRLDEAHKATGNYAYTTIVAYITAHHPYFRILALTATPGADVEKVQNVVDALHISRIEIREAEAPEIRKYMNTKVGLMSERAAIDFLPSTLKNMLYPCQT